jgi:O-antigen biosynthesis protein
VEGMLLSPRGRARARRVQMTDIGAWIRTRPVTHAAEPTHQRARPQRSGKIRALAFYLPQFHPIPENDSWWGAGFTEWTNVVKGWPRFVGHYQPHLPGELGFYDLRVPEVREQQAALAREYGLAGFCYYHYWFGGRRLLERPFQEVLRSKQPDFPFCLCWANENWSRRWDGSEHEILMAQQHSREDDQLLVRALFDAFADDRYIRVDNKPLFLVYRPMLLPNPRATADTWREECLKAGIGEIYLANVHSFDTVRPQDIGFDAAVEFPPNLKPLRRLNEQVELLDPEFHGEIYEYPETMLVTPPDYPLYRGIFPAWDNTARRRGTGTVVIGSTPDKYAQWLCEVCHYTLEHLSGDDRLVFVNAWNEWGEGCHLEPDVRFGRSYLEKTREVLKSFEWKALEATLA